jgi:imidazolonepropionase-like amidohydrolase
MRMSRLAVLATVWGVLWCPLDLAAQNLVITNARIITGAGTVIERGSIVVRDGRIVSTAAGGTQTMRSI